MITQKEYDLSKYINDNIEKSVDKIFSDYKLEIVNNHTKRVVEFAIALSYKFSVDKEKAKKAALLHDISGVVPYSKMIEYCHLHSINLINEEYELPLLTHQKISRHIAETQFGIDDEEILSAIACHTTMKKDASTLDKVLFISDKLEWDQNGEPPFKKLVLEALELSLNEAVYQYLKYNLDNKLLKIVHPEYQLAKDWLESNRNSI